MGEWGDGGLRGPHEVGLGGMGGWGVLFKSSPCPLVPLPPCPPVPLSPLPDLI
ncbi:hypothetical protein NIES4075_07430 [Tolypothrix sp. NIES-4075]|nr:hypothetical protein NIES4075_07430 [Tolypothrix sp. NIES-4075]